MNHALLIAVKAYVSACNVTTPPSYNGTSVTFTGTFSGSYYDTRTEGERELEKAQKKVDCEKATKKMLALLDGTKCSEE